jgi:hypothetical protein
MAIPSDRMIRLYTQIVLDQPKPTKLTAEESEWWDKIAKSTAEMKKDGYTPSIPHEWSM